MPQNFNVKFLKILKAANMMTGGGTTIEQLCDELGISRRSAFRLIDTMKNDLGFPVGDNREGSQGRKMYRLPESFLAQLSDITLPKLSFSLNEALLLRFLFSHDSAFQGTEITEDIQSLREKLSLLFPRANAKSVTPGNSFFVHSAKMAKSYAGKEFIIDTVFEALEHQNPCRIMYHSFSKNESKSMIIHPLKFVDHLGGLYILAGMPGRKHIVTLAAERIQEIELLDETFEYPEDIDIDALLNSAFTLTFDDPITATIRFSPKDAPYVRDRRLPGLEKIETHADGSCTLIISTSGVEDLIRWLLSFGPGAEVLSPESLREMLRKRTRSMADIYR
jgi:predicted DNA-binding transcriptional regulator YafY